MSIHTEVIELENTQITDEISVNLARISQTCGNYVGETYGNWCQAYSKCAFTLFLHIETTQDVNFNIERNITGYALLVAATKGLVEIFDVCFDSKYRGKGYAQELINFMVNKINQNGLSAWLGVKTDNPFFQAAMRTYIKAGFYADVKITEKTQVGGALGFDVVSLSLATTLPDKKTVDNVVKNAYTLIDEYYTKTNQKMLTFIVKETDIPSFRQFYVLDREYAGDFNFVSTGYEKEFFITINQDTLHTDPPDNNPPSKNNRCQVRMGSIKNIMFHTHPASCLNVEDAVLAIPSGADFASSFSASFQNIATPLVNNFMHIVITEDGLYTIRVNENFSTQFRKSNTDPHHLITQIDAITKAIMIVFSRLAYFIFASAATRNVEDMIDQILSGFNPDPTLNFTAKNVLIQSIQKENEKIALMMDRPPKDDPNLYLYLNLIKDILLRFFLTIYNNISIRFLLKLVQDATATLFANINFGTIEFKIIENIVTIHPTIADLPIFNTKLSAWPQKGNLVIKELVSITNNILE